MAKVGAQRAADLTGRSKSTIQRAMNNGKLSFEIDSSGRRVIDVSELDRAFGLKQAPVESKAVEQELEKASSMLEMERMKMRIRMLEQQIETAENQIEDLKGQRDQWQKQASQVLITSQYSQKQAEELRAELKMREEKARMRHQQRLKQRMKSMTPNNENAQGQADSSSEAFTFQDLWKRMKNRA